MVSGLAAALLPMPVFAGPRLRAIGWAGGAEVNADGRTLRLGIDTRVEPFRRARSRSWLLEAGQASARTLVIEPDRGWVERDGKRADLPARQAQHERQQYGIYGYLLRLAPERRDDGRITAAMPGFPPATLTLDDAGDVAVADYAVDDPEAAGTLAQSFAFSGWRTEAGVRWFRRMTITQAGKPFFTLDIERVTAEPA